MTCFWDGILNKITLDDINLYLSKNSTYFNIDQKEFISLLKVRAVRIPHSGYLVTIDGKFVTSKMNEENSEWIAGYDINKISQGHDCSISDPFLILIAHIFPIHIIHNYNGYTVNYKNVRNIKKTIRFESDQGHFS